MALELKTIAHIRTDFPTKFGIPRQSGLIEQLKAQIIFCNEYRNADALRGLEQYSHLWIIWEFSEAVRDSWSPTVRPPRLGGNTRMGVFATRSPFRPNPIGLSCVKLEKIELNTPQGPIIHITGADLLDNTPIFDIKPYLPYVDSHSDALNGFALAQNEGVLEVDFPHTLLEEIPKDKHESLIAVLKQDPRPQYQNDADRVYIMDFSCYEIHFKVTGNTLTVTDVRFTTR